MPRLVQVDRGFSNSALLAEAVALLQAGEVVAFPTETVYGLGADGLNPAAVARIYEVKGRPAHNPVILHVANPAAAQNLTMAWPNLADRLVEQFWPGPLTLVLPRANTIPSIVTAGGDWVAVRCPAHPVAQRLLTAFGRPLAAPSANRSQHISPTRAEHVAASLQDRVPLILDAGPTTGGIESTVVRVHADTLTVLRPGLISVDQLRFLQVPILGLTDPSQTNPTATAIAQLTPSALPSPGMMARHYAPTTPLQLLPTVDLLARLPALLQAAAENRPASGVVLLANTWQHLLEQQLTRPSTWPSSFIRVLPDEPAGYSRQLYDTLHGLDRQLFAQIWVELPPRTEAWLAVLDRLSRAATPIDPEPIS